MVRRRRRTELPEDSGATIAGDRADDFTARADLERDGVAGHDRVNVAGDERHLDVADRQEWMSPSVHAIAVDPCRGTDRGHVDIAADQLNAERCARLDRAALFLPAERAPFGHGESQRTKHAVGDGNETRIEL